MMASSLFPTDKKQINSICIGSGRFLRAVLVPALVASNLKPLIVQTRGRNFMDYCASRKEQNECWTYEVDTVEHNGDIKLEEIKFYGAGSLGTVEAKNQVLKMVSELENVKVIGVGVTEAGLASSSTKAMKDLFDILSQLASQFIQKKTTCNNPNGKICIVNTDNVSKNGNAIAKFMTELATTSEDGENIQVFLREKVMFLNSMVDRITSHREGSKGLVPRAEPTPTKALVIEDLGRDLPLELLQDNIKEEFGVVVRTKKGQLNADIALKLRVANGTHTAVAHVMALCRLLMTDVLSSPQDSPNHENATLLMKYLDSFFQNQILEGVLLTDVFQASAQDAEYVYKDWRQRLIHAHFGLSTFFITQNGAAKGGIRIGPTVVDLVRHGQPITCSTAFALAAVLRFLTPAERVLAKNNVYRGWFDKSQRHAINAGTVNGNESTTVYADGLSYNLEEGWYEFRCTCNMIVPSIMKGERSLPELLGSFATSQQPFCYEHVVRAYLTKKDGGDLSELADHHSTKDAFTKIVKAVSCLYARMVAGDGLLDILSNLSLDESCDSLIDGNCFDDVGDDDYRPLHFKGGSVPPESFLLKAKLSNNRDEMRSVVFSEVASTIAIDLHTHLLPPSHGALCLYGIDELLTYHYLVAEYFMTAPVAITPEDFYALTKQKQADMIWKALFIDRTPVSEACRGVVTTLVAFGLQQEVQSRDINAVRKFYSKYRDEGVAGAEKYSSMVYKKAGVRYAVMTNIPFDPTEAQHWKPKPKDYSSNYRSACRVDPLLAGDRNTVENALAAAGYEKTIEGAKQYLRDWCDIMKPEYMMASTPHNFVLEEDKGPVIKKQKTGVNEEAMKQPFAFTDLMSNNCAAECDGGEEGLASIIDENSDFLSEVLMKVCQERDLPLALKIGAHRNVNPSLLQAGDGVVAFADANMLARLCTKFPKVRFLATFLSRNNQHEACVLATKFRNLHIYGCWWYCNNPSIIEEITKMRVEMLGTAFTAQHSDSRVLDQLIYKWAHSRAVIANVLVKEYLKLVESGWSITRGELRRDINNIFGSSYEEFMTKSFT